MAKTISPCPFCGGTQCSFTGPYDQQVRCDRCGACGPVKVNSLEALRAWDEGVASTVMCRKLNKAEVHHILKSYKLSFGVKDNTYSDQDVYELYRRFYFEETAYFSPPFLKGAYVSKLGGRCSRCCSPIQPGEGLIIPDDPTTGPRGSAWRMAHKDCEQRAFEKQVKRENEK